MGTTKLLAEQALRSLGSLPSHLVIGDVELLIQQAIDLEEQSIERRRVHGPSEADIDDLMQRAFLPFGDPLKATIISALDEVGAKASVGRYERMLEVVEVVEGEDDTFIDGEEAAERDAFIQEVLGKDLELDEVLELSEKSSRHVDARTPSDHGDWIIMFGGEEISAHTGADALEKTLKRLVSADPSRVEKIATVRGRIRPLIAHKIDGLYPGRPDLGEFSREFSPGWFVGTNYSRRDVMRLIRAAVEACGLVWGGDVYVRA